MCFWFRQGENHGEGQSWGLDRERIMERIGMRTNLGILCSFDLIITTSIMQSDNESMSEYILSRKQESESENEHENRS